MVRERPDDADVGMTARKSPIKYEQVVEGEWFRPTKKHFEECCGCGMRHAIEHKIVDGELWMRVKVLRGPRRKAANGPR